MCYIEHTKTSDIIILIHRLQNFPPLFDSIQQIDHSIIYGSPSMALLWWFGITTEAQDGPRPLSRAPSTLHSMYAFVPLALACQKEEEGNGQLACFSHHFPPTLVPAKSVDILAREKPNRSAPTRCPWSREAHGKRLRWVCRATGEKRQGRSHGLVPRRRIYSSVTSVI